MAVCNRRLVALLVTLVNTNGYCGFSITDSHFQMVFRMDLQQQQSREFPEVMGTLSPSISTIPLSHMACQINIKRLNVSFPFTASANFLCRWPHLPSFCYKVWDTRSNATYNLTQQNLVMSCSMSSHWNPSRSAGRAAGKVSFTCCNQRSYKVVC